MQNLPLLGMVGVIACALGNAQAAVTDYIGSGHDWNVSWHAYQGLNDPSDNKIPGALDFVGDSSDPCFYMANTTDYLYFRFRVATPTGVAGTFAGAHLVMIDIPGYLYPNGTGTNTNGSVPDYAITWDSKSNDPTAHGLEMSVVDVRDDTWDGIRMDDLDGSNGQKLTSDINGAGRSGDGYVQVIDSIPTENFGDTTFINFSVSWNYLEDKTDLERDMELILALASINNATDHNYIDADVAGGANVDSPTTLGFTTVGIVAVPEPAILASLNIAALIMLLRRRRPLTSHGSPLSSTP